MIHQNHIVEPNELVPLLTLNARRAITSVMPSCVKSFILPIAFCFHKLSKKITTVLEILSVMGNQGVSIPDLLHKWIEYTPKFTDDSTRVSYLGLLTILTATC